MNWREILIVRDTDTGAIHAHVTAFEPDEKGFLQPVTRPINTPDSINSLIGVESKGVFDVLHADALKVTMDTQEKLRKYEEAEQEAVSATPTKKDGVIMSFVKGLFT